MSASAQPAIIWLEDEEAKVILEVDTCRDGAALTPGAVAVEGVVDAIGRFESACTLLV